MGSSSSDIAVAGVSSAIGVPLRSTSHAQRLVGDAALSHSTAASGNDFATWVSRAGTRPGRDVFW